MKSSRILSCFMAALLFGACGGPSQEQILKVKLQKLTFNTLYDEDMVYDVVFDSEELNIDSVKSASRILFLQGVDLFKNKRNPAAAVTKFKSSILIFPDAKTYYELGCALSAVGYTEDIRKEALSAFEIALKLHFEPEGKVHYKMACVNYQKYVKNAEHANMWPVVYQLRQSFTNGFFDTVAVAKDPLLAGITSEPQYKELVLEMIAQNQQGASLFDLYKRAYTNNMEKFTLQPEKVEMNEFRQSINYDFAKFVPEMENISFGRDVSNDFYFVGRVKETELYHAFLYTSVAFEEEDLQPVLTYLVVYDTEGEILSSKMVGCQCSAEKIKTFSVNDGVIEITDMKRKWEQSITEVSFEKNKVVGYDALAKATFKIDETGHIINVEVPANYTDSSLFTQTTAYE